MAKLRTHATMKPESVRAVANEAIRLIGRPQDMNAVPALQDSARQQLPYDDLIDVLRGRPQFRPGPDVVLLGTARSGTSWLFNHCFESGRTVQSPFKEVNFLTFQGPQTNDYFRDPMGRRNWLGYWLQFMEQSDHWMTAGQTDMTVLTLAHLLGPRDWQWYETILGSAGGRRSIDLTPGNHRMHLAAARTLAQTYPHTRYGFILRHPLDLIRSMLARSPRVPPIEVDLYDEDALAHSSPSELPPSMHNFLFGRRLLELIQELGHVELFFFDDLRRNPVEFMKGFSDRFGLGIQTHDGMNAPIHDLPAKKVTMTRRALDLLADDVQQLRVLVPQERLDRWIGDIERERSGS